jgi:AAA domain-containing protein
MEPGDGRAVCPRCGRAGDAAALRPLFIITGASGSGKTAVFAPLARRLRGRCVTFDADLLIDAAGALSGSQPINWAAFGDAWLVVAHAVAQSGLPTVLLGPFLPERVQEFPARRWVGDIHFIVLDCPDDLRRARISARPSWRSRDIDEQVEFGQWLRRSIADRVDTSRGTPDDTAASVAAWIGGHLDTAGQARRESGQIV